MVVAVLGVSATYLFPYAEIVVPVGSLRSFDGRVVGVKMGPKREHLPIWSDDVQRRGWGNRILWTHVNIQAAAILALASLVYIFGRHSDSRLKNDAAASKSSRDLISTDSTPSKLKMKVLDVAEIKIAIKRKCLNLLQIKEHEMELSFDALRVAPVNILDLLDELENQYNISISRVDRKKIQSPADLVRAVVEQVNARPIETTGPEIPLLSTEEGRIGSTNPPVTEPTWADMHGCLLAWLVFGIIGNTVGGLLLLDWGARHGGYFIFSGINAWAAVVCAIGVLRWKKWGVVGYCICNGLAGLAGLAAGNPIALVMTIVPIGIFLGLLNAGKHKAIKWMK